MRFGESIEFTPMDSETPSRKVNGMVAPTQNGI